MTLKKRITLQRVSTIEDAKRAFAEIEKVINQLEVDSAGNVVLAPTNNAGKLKTVIQSVSSTPGGPGPKGDKGDKGDPGVDGTTGMVPTYIAPGETFTVPANRQALYALPIVNDGDLIVTGDLIEVS